MYHLITKVKFILCSISSGLLFWSVNYTSLCENSKLYVFKNVEFVGGISNESPNDLFRMKLCKPLESC